MPKISIIPENIEFDIDYTENILSAGLNQNLNLPHGCKSGNCGACKCKVQLGDIDLDEYNKNVLKDEEIEQGYTLLCKAHAKTDVVLYIPHFLHGFPIKMLPARVEKIKKINTTAIIILKIPATQKFGFYAGQYIDIMHKGKNRSYSLAGNPKKNDELELHVRYYNKGIFSEFVWNELKEQQILRFKGPLGNFRLQETENPIILICTGTGFAPIKSIIESIISDNIKKEIHLYWGNRTKEDFYLLELLPQWQEQL
ncbi:MAG TPA: FAD-binding oxidoreductase, partial [Burkholderiales bacterium]|nr:FAD-binding oxidoreductase [Burkholderiales bacterium]